MSAPLERPFARGTLWSEVTRRTNEARAGGSLQFIASELTYVKESGIAFPVRRISKLPSKLAPGAETRHAISPFLEPEPALRIADVSPTHICLLNKFPVVEHHILIVTRHYEDQDEPLNLRDFVALWRCMVEYPALGFYNGGPTAGASQTHKHLQMVPLPLAPDGPRIPIEPLLNATRLTPFPQRAWRLPFLHVVMSLPPGIADSADEGGGVAWRLFQAMVRQLGRDPVVTPQEPYNLLVTREWMLLVPRSREQLGSMSLNALAFAGHFVVRSEEEMGILREFGPLGVLRQIGA